MDYGQDCGKLSAPASGYLPCSNSVMGVSRWSSTYTAAGTWTTHGSSHGHSQESLAGLKSYGAFSISDVDPYCSVSSGHTILTGLFTAVELIALEPLENESDIVDRAPLLRRPSREACPVHFVIDTDLYLTEKLIALMTC